jgi:CDGSH-type Zn-finger protein
MESQFDIVVNNNGSLRVKGKFVLRDGQGNAFDLSGRESISLCRCGHSKDKPFCDGSHRTASFESTVQARKLEPLRPRPIP